MTDRSHVVEGFDLAARRYDLMVALNPGYRRHLRRAAEQVVAGANDLYPTYLDLGCGSGLSTRELLRAARRRGQVPRIIGVDASDGMLARARRRRWPEGVVFVTGRGERLDELGLPEADGILTCYLLRNVTDVPATLRGVRRLLRPGGWFVAEDYSVADDPSAARRWHLVNRMVISPLARWVGGDPQLYAYLHASVDDFPGANEVAGMLSRTGFTHVARRSVPGWQRGILHLWRGQ